MCPLHKRKNEPFVDTTTTTPKDATFYLQSSLKASDIKRLPTIPLPRILLSYVRETKCERRTFATTLFAYANAPNIHTHRPLSSSE